MFCGSCGSQVDDSKNFCPNCGAPLSAPAGASGGAPYDAAPSGFQDTPSQPYYYTNNAGYCDPNPAPYANHERENTLYLVGFILNIVSTLSLAPLIIPLAWMIPMTIRSYGMYKCTKPNTTGFAICTLIFLNIVSGILYLVAQKDE